MKVTRVKVITGYAAHARFNAEIAEADWNIGTIPRQPQIPSPYAYSSSHVVSRWQGIPVIIVETRHRRYEVFRVDGPIGPRDLDACRCGGRGYHHAGCQEIGYPERESS